MAIAQSMNQMLKKPYFLFFSIILFFTPLLMVTNTNELFEFPKMYFVYILGFFIICFFISDLLLNKTKFIKPSPVVLLFFCITLLSTVLSSHVYTSFFGYYTRFNDGLLSYIVFFGLYIVALNKLAKEDFYDLIKIAILPIIPVGIYGLVQHFGGPGILWSGSPVERVYSTLGQPNWLAQYLVILLMFCLYFGLVADYKNFKYWFLLYTLGFFCFWVTYSMSGIFGFMTGVIALTFIIFKAEKTNGTQIENLPGRLILLLLISFSIVVTNLGLFKGKLNDLLIDVKKTVTVVQKAYALTNGYEVSDPGFIRLELWKSTLNLITASPKTFLIGTGPETFPYTFQKFRNTKLNYSSEWDYVFNKPHNYYLELWAESGIFALVIYLILLYTLLKNVPQLLIPALVAFAVTNFFGWPVVVTALLFWFFVSWSEVWKRA